MPLTHVAGETAAQTIARFESAMLGAWKQGVTLSEGTQKRALLARPPEHYTPIRTVCHLARGIKPDFKWIEDSMLDFDRDFWAKRDTAGVREGAAAMEALWNEHQKGGSGSGRSSTPKYRKPDMGRKAENCFFAAETLGTMPTTAAFGRSFAAIAVKRATSKRLV